MCAGPCALIPLEISTPGPLHHNRDVRSRFRSVLIDTVELLYPFSFVSNITMKNFNHTPAAYSKVPQTDTDEDVTVHPPRLIHQAVAYLAAWEAIAATAIYYASDIDTFDLFFICAAFVPVRFLAPSHTLKHY